MINVANHQSLKFSKLMFFSSCKVKERILLINIQGLINLKIMP